MKKLYSIEDIYSQNKEYTKLICYTYILLLRVSGGIMEMLTNFIQIFLHLDDNLKLVIQDYGAWTYLILFLIIFCETGLVVTPFFPGDSILFVVGAFAAAGTLDLWWLLGLLGIAAVAGDSVNFWIGKYLGTRLNNKSIFFCEKGIHGTNAQVL